MADTDIAPASDGAKDEIPKRNPILRYDQVYDIQSSQYRLLKSVKSELKKQNGRKAILVVRRLIDDKGFHTKTEVDIKSKWVTEAMRDINADVEDISLRTNPPVVPLEIFYHSKFALQQKLEEAKAAGPPDEETVNHLAVAAKFAEDEFSITTANLETLLADKEITWELLWTIFTPNILVYRYHQLTEQDQVLKLCSMRQVKRLNKTRYWMLDCRIVADDGVKFGSAYEPYFMKIEEFSGARKITDLRIFPLKYHEKEAEIRAQAIDRGRRFAELREPRVMETIGAAMFEKRDSRWEAHQFKFNASGRTIIDPASFRSFNPNIEFMPEVNRAISRDELTEEELIICTPLAFGFCFANKEWGAYPMSRLVDVKWNDQAFKDLVMDRSTKMLVHSMVKQHSSHDDTFDDIVSGKGKGIVCLFSGPPGSGKTLTAEAVAETTKRPLYSVSAGDLGIDPHTVDRKLTQVLEQSSRWNAVLLLDEADVFLQQRTPQDVKRNALVSIFLRQLEYYQGILILTTNRIANCDTALESRIHISIPYPDLDETARAKIWITFLRKLKETQQAVVVDLTEEDISRLAKVQVNGRQIKNIFNGARIIAKEMGEVLSVSHFNLVLSVTALGFQGQKALQNGTHPKGLCDGEE